MLSNVPIRVSPVFVRLRLGRQVVQSNPRTGFAAQPAFSSNTGSVRSRFLTIASVITISLTFLLPGT